MSDHDSTTGGCRREVLPPEDRDLEVEIDEALNKVIDVIKAYPEDMHGDLCIGSFRHLQMGVRPASGPGLWDRPAPPSKRHLVLPGSNPAEPAAPLDSQLQDFASVVVGMIMDYPLEHRCHVRHAFFQELRSLLERAGDSQVQGTT